MEVALPQTTFKQREHLYEDVESLITPGFLSCIVTIEDQRLALRSLGPGDLFLLQMRAGLNAGEWKKWSVAASIWMVDGHNVLGQDWMVPRFADLFQRLPPVVREILFTQVLGLFARARAAIRATEAYIHENTSRYSWKTIGPDPRLNTGVAGAQSLGLNHIQRMWVAFNDNEDRRIVQEAGWEGFKLSAIGTAPKAIQKLDEGDRRRHEEEDARRQMLRDRYYYWKAGVVPDSIFDEGSAEGTRISASKSAQDLEAEMQQWVSGEHDEHDLIVAQYKQRISDRMHQDEQERRLRVAALQEKRHEIEEYGIGGPTQLVAYTPEQLQEMLAQRGEGGGPSTRFIGPERDDQRYLYDRYLTAEESAAGLKVVGGKIVHPHSDPNKDARTLDQLVKGRQVKMGDGS